MQIRPGSADDLDAIARIHAASWADAYRGIMEDDFLDGPVVDDRLDAWSGRLAARPDPSVLLISESGGGVTGFLYAFPDEDPDWMLLDNLHVLADQRGLGTGLTLMHAFGRELDRLGLRKVRLLVLDGNDGACRFYDRLGGSRQPIVHKGFRGLGPFASIPYTWRNFPETMSRLAEPS